ncbi:MAG: type pilus assembly protein PilM [Solirubrobacterales bacterium]|nr:type pilus assembly protein PilM [Solirubrobacterales bacterium]
MTPVMLSSHKPNSTVGLDIEAGSIAAVEVSVNGSTRIAQTAIAPLSAGIVKEGEVMDAAELGVSLKALFAEHKLSKSVRLGVANQRIAVRTLQLPLIEDPDELDTAVRFQAQEHIPMPLTQAVIDYQVVGRQREDEGGHMEVVVVAARRDMLEAPLQALRAAGLRPVGLDLAAFGMIRALGAEQAGVDPAGTSAVAYCNLGDVTNLAVARGSACLFTRISPFGLEAIASRLAERRGLSLDHARAWLGHVGLVKPTAEIEGDSATIELAREALEDGVTKLTNELRLSLEFYAAQEGAVLVERAIVCGAGSLIEGFADRLGEGLGLRFDAAKPPALGHLDEADAARLTLSYGLALDD